MKKPRRCSGLDGLIDGDRYFMSQRIKTLKAIRAKIRPEPVREPLPPPPKQYAPAAGDREAEMARGTLNCENHPISYEQVGF